MIQPGRQRPRRRVRATDLADMGFCELKCQLKARLGEQDTATSLAAKREGIAEHHRFHEEVRAHHNDVSRGRSRDARCFIASVVYGADDARTDQLRRFRDEHMLSTGIGRKAVEVYYWGSPRLARTLERRPWLQGPVRCGIDLIRLGIELVNLGKEARPYGNVQPRDPLQDSHHGSTDCCTCR